MKATIISIGHELITGQCVDTNAAWLAEQLTTCGVQVTAHQTVGDDLVGIRCAIESALRSNDLVILTGGLGPTVDDLTRHAIADFLTCPLEEDPGSLARLREMFDRWQRPFHEENRIQALIPKGCRAIPNEKGTAPGIAFATEAKRGYALPGVPSEMKTMFRKGVLPAIESAADGAVCTCSERLLCFGMSEAKLGGLIVDLMERGRNPLVGTTASEGVISVRITATAQSMAECRALLEADTTEVRKRLGHVVFATGDATLAGAVGGLLVDRRMTVATAESCTGGLLAKMITDTPGSSNYFLQGFVTYCNASKQQLLGVSEADLSAEGAVSEAVARSMAIGCRNAAGTDVALSTTGIAGPGGGRLPDKPVGLVYIGLATESDVEVKRVLVGSHLDRDQVRDRAARIALNLLRLRLLRTP